jgi:hypothetical protein
MARQKRHFRRGHAAVPGLAVALVGVVAILSAASVSTAATRPGKRRPGVVVLSPRNGARLPAQSQLIRIRVNRVALAGVTLNGRQIRSGFALLAGVWQLRVSPNEGLRYGSNVLRVTARASHRRKRVTTVRFRIRSNAPLAAAGLDKEVGVGSSVQLSGLASLPVPGSSGPSSSGRAGASDLSFSWKILNVPDRGLAASPPNLVPENLASLGSAPGSPGGLLGDATPSPMLQTTRPGVYTVELTVRDSEGRSGSDLVDVRVDPPPALTVDTMAQNGNQWGIDLGGKFYAETPGRYLQVLAIDRETGAFISNTSYPCPDTRGSNWLKCTTDVRDGIKKLGPTALVIAAAQPDGGGTTASPRGAQYALSGLGGPNVPFPTGGDDLVRGTISEIGVPGLSETVQHVASTNTVGAGEISGYLIRNNELHYRFQATDLVSFDTQAEGSNEHQNVITLGAMKYTEQVGGVPGGFQVVVVDSRTLQGSSHFFATGQAKGQAALNVISAMRDTLQRANSDKYKLVVIATRGNPTIAIRAYDGLARSHELYHAIRDMASAAESLGATRSSIYKVIDNDFYQPNHDSFTLVGHSGAGAGFGQEARGAASTNPGSLNTAPLGGTLARATNYYGYEPQVTDNEAAVGNHDHTNQATQLLGWVLHAPTSWPNADDKGVQAAYSWIGEQPTVGLGTDPRNQYYTLSYDGADWPDKQRAIEALKPTGLPAGITEQDFTTAQTELDQEITWLKQVHGYLVALATPYAKTSLKSWAELQSLADEINKEVRADPDAKTRAIAAAVFNGFRRSLDALPKPVGHVFDIANTIYETVQEIVEIGKSEPVDEFQSTVNKVGSDLASRLVAAQTTLENQYFYAIASDYGKLRTVAACVSGNKVVCPDDPSTWQLTNDDLFHMGEGLEVSLKGFFYSVLLPAKYTLWKLRPQGGASDTSPRDYYGVGALGFGKFYPFKDQPDSAQVGVVECRDMVDHSRDQWQVYALGIRSGSGTVTDPYSMQTPSAKVTDPIFESAPKGLGNDRETFFDRYFHAETLDHYPLGGSIMDWNSGYFSSDCFAP